MLKTVLRFFRELKPLDYVAFGVALAAVLSISAYAYTGTEAGSQVRIRGPEQTYLYPLDTETELSVDGPLGETHIEIENGEVHVVSSPCRDKICIQAGHVSRAGEWVACLPNQVFLKIEGERSSEVDAQTF
jgi:hypothetical protein